MSRRLLLAACWSAMALSISPAPTAAQQPAQESCLTCHLALGDQRLSDPANRFPADIHAIRGFGCSACHGGDPSILGPDAMDPEKGYVGVPARRIIPEVCGRCHSSFEFMRRYDPDARVDQVSEYWTSVHGRRLAEVDDSAVATCADCHRVHSIRQVSHPQSSVYPTNVAGLCGSCHSDAERMRPYGIPTDQAERYARSVHSEKMSEGGDLSAPTCNDCHGNHGATPPGVSWVGNVCGQCHSVEAGYFAGSFHSQIFTVLGTPGCATCHGNHEILLPGDELLGVEEGAVCARCHTPESAGGQRATTLRSLIDSLHAGYDHADSLLERAEETGMEVSQARFDLGEATNALVRARAAVHTFSVDSVRAPVESGLEIATAARDRGLGALRELRTRRLGLGASAAVILVLIVGLVLKIRELEGTG